MNIIKNPDVVFKSFDNGEYKAYKSARYKLVDDSVILVCGLCGFRGLLFDEYYSCIPVFSHFDLSSSFLREPTGFSARRESGIKEDTFLWISPKAEDEEETIEIASAHVDYAYERLEKIKTLDDCLSFYERWYEEESQMILGCSPKIFNLDILIFRREFDKCRSLLEKALKNNIRWAFEHNGLEFPEDENWRKYLPESCESASSKLERDLYHVEQACWKRIRTPLEEGRYYELCSELMQNYQKNKKLLKKVGIQLVERSDEMMEEMMRAVEVYK